MGTTVGHPLLSKLAKRKPVLTSDHPLSIGRRLIVVSTSKYSKKSVKISRNKMSQYLAFHKAETCDGLHAEWDDCRTTIIAVNISHDNPARLVQVVVHEVSHFVDAMFASTSLVLVDTELRAYYLDWVVGKVLSHFNLFKA